MKESRADTRNALLQATGLHVLLFALLFAGLHWNRSNLVELAHGDVIQADLIDPSALSASMQRALQRDPKALPKPVAEPTPTPTPTPPDPVPEPLPEPVVDELPPPPVQVPDQVDQEKVQKDADAPDPAKVQREQEAKRRQQQVDLDAEENEKKLADIRKRREQATREVAMAEQKARQLADARQQQSKAPPLGDPKSRSSDSAGYVQAVQAAILREWTRPESVRIGEVCPISIKQIPGGDVVEVRVLPECPYDELGRRSVEAAVLKASPLPYAGYEDAWRRIITFNFRAQDQ